MSEQANERKSELNERPTHSASSTECVAGGGGRPGWRARNEAKHPDYHPPTLARPLCWFVVIFTTNSSRPKKSFYLLNCPSASGGANATRRLRPTIVEVRIEEGGRSPPAPLRCCRFSWRATEETATAAARSRNSGRPLMAVKETSPSRVGTTEGAVTEEPLGHHLNTLSPKAARPSTSRAAGNRFSRAIRGLADPIFDRFFPSNSSPRLLEIPAGRFLGRMTAESGLPEAGDLR